MSVPTANDTWISINTPYTSDITLVNNTFAAITQAYSSGNRHYHTMQHIEHLLSLCHQYADHIKDRDTLLFAVFFHDIIYDIPGAENEEQSAAAAVNYLHKINYPSSDIAVVKDYIIIVTLRVQGLRFF